ncbi:MAG: hypothetical protein IKK39_10430 [Thermoguttaceae bacterium]|nr:hypothetical protein [Thermoguttaceae bacterium]MBR4104461.1 hypothetical protein [Thermoguttaceae bacterium]
MRAEQLGIDVAFDRFDRQKTQCGFGLAGVCCKICNMGPCRVTEKAPRGVCGADADLIVARNLLRATATGTAQHGARSRNDFSVEMGRAREDRSPYSKRAKGFSDRESVRNRDGRASVKRVVVDLADALLDDLSRTERFQNDRGLRPSGTAPSLGSS